MPAGAPSRAMESHFVKLEPGETVFCQVPAAIKQRRALEMKLRLRPDDATTLEALSELQFQTGQYEDAAYTSERAMACQARRFN